MSSYLLGALVLFGLAMVFGATTTAWRRALTGSSKVTRSMDVHLPRVTAIVPARNEEDNIALVLQDLFAQEYPRDRLDVIVVDDDSSDATAPRVNAMIPRWPGLRLVRSAEAGKKAAITLGVEMAAGELIVLTDADVRFGPERIRAIADHWLKEQSALIVLPVRTEGSGILGALQAEEQAALLGMAMATALAGHAVLAYGANLAFTRAAFEAVGGYGGDRFSSGDDLFLLRRMQATDKPVSACLDPRVIVTTAARPSLGAAVEQRLRWVGKMRGAMGAVSMGGLIALLYPWILLCASLGFSFTGGMGQHALYTAGLLAASWLIWALPLIGLVRDVRRGSNDRSSALVTLLSLAAFSIYAPLIAIASLVLAPKWKGRRVRT